MFNTIAPIVTLQRRQPLVDDLKSVNALMLRTKSVLTPQIGGLRLIRYLMDSWLGAVLGGGVYGAWAVWANWSQGASTAWGIGAAHWLTSAMLTFFGTMAMRQFYGQASGWRGSLRAFGGGLALTYVSLFAVHGLLGTQQLLLTLAPGIIPSILFCSSYALLLKRTAIKVTQ
jgi:hypothetical protein